MILKIRYKLDLNLDKNKLLEHCVSVRNTVFSLRFKQLFYFLINIFNDLTNNRLIIDEED